MKHMVNDVNKIIGDVYEEHKRTLDPDHPRDFMDVFIQEINMAEKVWT
jgi:hypothetical protein